jgi:chromosome partitioning protein
MPHTLAILCPKGGTGKTTAAVSLYAATLSRGYSSGIADLDPQGNATSWSIGEALFRSMPADDGVAAFLAPGGRAITAAHRHLFPRNDQNANDQFPGNTTPSTPPHLTPCGRLPGGYILAANPRLDVHSAESIRLDLVPLDIVVVDTPPGLPGALVRSIVGQTTAIVVPVTPEPWAVSNVSTLLADIVDAGRADLIESRLVRVLITQRQRTALHEATERDIRKRWPKLVSKLVIPRATAWAEVSHERVPWNPRSKPATTGVELLDELNTLHRKAAA